MKYFMLDLLQDFVTTFHFIFVKHKITTVIISGLMMLFPFAIMYIGFHTENGVETVHAILAPIVSLVEFLWIR